MGVCGGCGGGGGGYVNLKTTPSMLMLRGAAREVVVSVQVCKLRVSCSSVQVPISTEHFPFFYITAEWPNTTHIAAILSSHGTYNVICI